ncbi:MAG TPA: ROK family transcriptional regulator [Bryobacteraceae bacterium]|jgi:predicted NBD/HSP70 family sugar kinase
MRQVDLNQPAAASSETARRINRGIVLNLIRNRQPVSRADVARFSGLQRSTVSLIVEELIEDEWVVEGSLGRLPRGRRPTFLQLNEKRAVICVDIRPSGINIGVGDVNGVFTPQDGFPTPQDPTVAVKELVKRIKALIKKRVGTPFDGIGVSMPGRIDLSTHQLVFAPNLRWPAMDLQDALERATGLSVELENAANACALAEIWFGHSGKMRDLVAITVSEGIGTGIIAHGQLISGRRGMAGEFGHVPLEPDGPLCSCGNRGCWEVLASNRAAVRYYTESNPNRAAATLTFTELLALAEKGDVLADRALTRMAVQIGRGTRMIVAGLAPEAITFIGEFTSAWSRFRPVIEAEVRAQSISSEPTILLAGQNGATARLRGTIALIFLKHFGPPAKSPN